MNRILISLAALLGPAGPLLIDSTLKGVALLVLAGIAAVALRNASAAARHLVWLFAVGALLMLPMLSALLPNWRVLPSWTAMTVPARLAFTTEARFLTPSHHLPVAATPPTAVSSTQVASAPRAVPEKSLTIRDWFPLVWATGFTLLLTRLLAASWLLSRAARGCAVAVDERLAQLVQTARKQLDIRQPLQVLLDQRSTIPMVWGTLRPRLLLPAEAVEWADSQLRSVLLHELAHVKRCDMAVQWLMQVACALHWFNPLVWLAAWRLHAESENACDNLVLTSGVRASEYAEHLLNVATKFSAAGWTHACGLAVARPSRLEGRLLTVLNERLNRRSVTRSLAAAALVIGLCVIIPVAMLRAADDTRTDGPTNNSTIAGQKSNASPSSAPKRKHNSVWEWRNTKRSGSPKGNAAEKTSPSQLKKERLLQILVEEIQVAEGQAKLIGDQYKAGTATFETSLRVELDVLALKQEAACLEGNMEQAKDLIRQQIHALEDLQGATSARMKAGVASQADELKLRRAILSLKRQQAELE